MAAMADFFPSLRNAFFVFLLCAAPAPASAEPADDGDSIEHYFRALEHINEYRFDAARSELKAAIATCPDNPAQLYLELGKVEQTEGRTLQALTNFRKAGEHDPELVEARYAEAEALTVLQRTEEAEAVWSAIADRDPGQTEALARLAESLQDRQDYEAALATWRRLLKANPSDPQAIYGFIALASGLGRCSEALEVLKSVPPSGLPGIAPVLFTASCFRKSGLTNESFALLQADWPDFEDVPSRPILLNALAEQCFLLGRDEECLAVLDGYAKTGEPLPYELSVIRSAISGEDLSNALVTCLILADRPENNPAATAALPRILLRLGKSSEAYEAFLNDARHSWSDGDPDRCLRALRQAGACATDDDFSHRILLSMVLREQGRTNEADEAFRSGLAVRPPNCGLQEQKARLLLEIRDPVHAYGEIIPWAVCSSSNLDACTAAALTALELGRNEEALVWSRRILRDRPDDGDANMFAGYALIGLSRWSDAIPHLERARQADPSGHAVLFYLAQCLDQTGRDREAIPVMEEAVRLKPDEAPYLNYLGYLMADCATNLPQAEKYVAAAVAAEPDNPFYLDSLGWTHYRMGRFKDALSELLKAVGSMEIKGIKEPAIYEHAGDVCSALKDTKNARVWWKKALELDPSNKALKKKAR
jgi:tetratricopeptide (TPR) repeat protein